MEQSLVRYLQLLVGEFVPQVLVDCNFAGVLKVEQHK